MSTFRVSVPTTLPPSRAFEVATDWRGHSRMPFTTVTVTRPTGGVGTRFVGRTAVGRFGFDDPMEVTAWQPPECRDRQSGDGQSGDGHRLGGHCAVVKLGTVVRGDATVDVTPGDRGGSVVHWRETAAVGPERVSRLLGPLVRLTGRLLFGALLRAQLREAERNEAARA